MEVVGEDKDVERGPTDPRLKPGVSGGVLLLWLFLFNVDLISCFLTCLQFDLVLQPWPFYRDMPPDWLFKRIFKSLLWLFLTDILQIRLRRLVHLIQTYSQAFLHSKYLKETYHFQLLMAFTWKIVSNVSIFNHYLYTCSFSLLPCFSRDTCNGAVHFHFT